MTKKNGTNWGSGSAVGYRNPPREHRFVKGKSGNPSGRPRGSKSLMTLIDDELNRRIKVTEGGKQRYITKKQAAAKQFVNNLLRGDPAAIKMMLGGPFSHETVAFDPQEEARRQEQVKSIADALDENYAYRLKYGPLKPADPEPPKEDESK